MTPPSRSRCCTRKSRITRRCGRFTRKKSARIRRRRSTAVRNELEAAHTGRERHAEKTAPAQAAVLLVALQARPLRQRLRSGHRSRARRPRKSYGFADELSAGFRDSSESEKAARAARRNGAWQAPRGLRHGRSARVRNAAAGRARPCGSPGQDTRRGTFNQTHAALVDTRNEAEYVPLEHLAPEQARCEIYNSTLSEAGVLGFEYGYSRDYPEALVLWEAQFGDFANSAQIIIDQFISAAEDKWDLPSGVGLLLPHGYEGPGPGTFQRADRALPAARRRGQHSSLPAVERRAIFSAAAPPGAAPLAQADDRVHAEEHAAASRRVFADRGFSAAAIRVGGARPRSHVRRSAS